MRIDNGILLDYLSSEVALEEHEIGSIDSNIPIDNNCTDDEFHFGMPWGSGDDEDQGNESDNRDDIPTVSRRRQPTTEIERCDLRLSDVDGYEGEDGDRANAHDEEEASQPDHGSPQNVED